jgi:hypothetical protein
MRARLAMQDALDDDRIARQTKHAGNGGGSNDRSPPSRAIIRYSALLSLHCSVNTAYHVIQWPSSSSIERDRIQTHAAHRCGA